MDIHSTLYQTRGAVSAVAKTLGLSVPAVSQWKRRGIPGGRRQAVEAALRAHLASFSVSETNSIGPNSASNEIAREAQ